jgi:hypothetical protein
MNLFLFSLNIFDVKIMASCHKIDNNQNMFFSVKIMTFYDVEKLAFKKKKFYSKIPT